MIVIFLVTFIYILSDPNGVKSAELPNYIPKCSLSDPNLNECIKENANSIIAILAKGDIDFGIPSLSPVVFQEAPGHGKNISFVLYNTYHDNIKDMQLDKASYDLENAKNYTILSGKFIDVTAKGQVLLGHGRFNMTLERVIMEYKADISKYEKRGDIYLDLTKSDLSTTNGHSYFYFENLKSPERADVNDYINKNSKIFVGQLKPILDRYLNTFFSYTLNVIFGKVPFTEMFLP
ncbi:hemolymph juvenile hormone binding protein (JHBP) [Popillia japonica]|uniref:Hemolymph juvenile hormone binding protein (JHBP) n=1 Tax=Popillia japonica TaxID=7064 RepID=A0AAW1IAH8_POPJA